MHGGIRLPVQSWPFQQFVHCLEQWCAKDDPTEETFHNRFFNLFFSVEILEFQAARIFIHWIEKDYFLLGQRALRSYWCVEHLGAGAFFFPCRDTYLEPSHTDGSTGKIAMGVLRDHNYPVAMCDRHDPTPLIRTLRTWPNKKNNDESHDGSSSTSSNPWAGSLLCRAPICGPAGRQRLSCPYAAPIGLEHIFVRFIHLRAVNWHSHRRGLMNVHSEQLWNFLRLREVGRFLLCSLGLLVRLGPALASSSN